MWYCVWKVAHVMIEGIEKIPSKHEYAIFCTFLHEKLPTPNWMLFWKWHAFEKCYAILPDFAYKRLPNLDTERNNWQIMYEKFRRNVIFVINVSTCKIFLKIVLFFTILFLKEVWDNAMQTPMIHRNLQNFSIIWHYDMTAQNNLWLWYFPRIFITKEKVHQPDIGHPR